MSPKRPKNETFISNSLFVELIGLSYTLVGMVDREEKAKHRKEMWKTNFPCLGSRRKKIRKELERKKSTRAYTFLSVQNWMEMEG
jgi:hypothetical protein